MIVLNISTVLALAFGCLVAGYLTPVIWRTWRSLKQRAKGCNLAKESASDYRKWEYGTVNGVRARRSRTNGLVQRFIRRDGDFGGADTFWESLIPDDAAAFVPYGETRYERETWKTGGLV